MALGRVEREGEVSPPLGLQNLGRRDHEVASFHRRVVRAGGRWAGSVEINVGAATGRQQALPLPESLLGRLRSLLYSESGKRDLRLDFLRGLVITAMVIDHIVATPRSTSSPAPAAGSSRRRSSSSSWPAWCWASSTAIV